MLCSSFCLHSKNPYKAVEILVTSRELQNLVGLSTILESLDEIKHENYDGISEDAKETASAY